MCKDVIMSKVLSYMHDIFFFTWILWFCDCMTWNNLFLLFFYTSLIIWKAYSAGGFSCCLSFNWHLFLISVVGIINCWKNLSRCEFHFQGEKANLVQTCNKILSVAMAILFFLVFLIFERDVLQWIFYILLQTHSKYTFLETNFFKSVLRWFFV